MKLVLNIKQIYFINNLRYFLMKHFSNFQIQFHATVCNKGDNLEFMFTIKKMVAGKKNTILFSYNKQ